MFSLEMEVGGHGVTLGVYYTDKDDLTGGVCPSSAPLRSRSL